MRRPGHVFEDFLGRWGTPNRQKIQQYENRKCWICHLPLADLVLRESRCWTVKNLFVARTANYMCWPLRRVMRIRRRKKKERQESGGNGHAPQASGAALLSKAPVTMRRKPAFLVQLLMRLGRSRKQQRAAHSQSLQMQVTRGKAQGRLFRVGRRPPV